MVKIFCILTVKFKIIKIPFRSDSTTTPTTTTTTTTTTSSDINTSSSNNSIFDETKPTIDPKQPYVPNNSFSKLKKFNVNTSNESINENKSNISEQHQVCIAFTIFHTLIISKLF